MTRKLKIAPIQMDATPAPLGQRLVRAADLIAEAASAGAQLVVLPELFNSGYEYHERNYQLAEPLDGETVRWMKTQAAEHRVHLAGTLLIRDEEEIYNTALLIALDGRTWRYDKHYPFAWERAYFREGERITVADTDLGKLGMMICWDSAHAELWERYAGKVDAMVIMSCPPAFNDLQLVFPDGERVASSELGGMWQTLDTTDMPVFGSDLDARAAWMRVPVVNTVGAGTFRTHLPLPIVSLGGYLATRPDLWAWLEQAEQVEVVSRYDKQGKVVDANGNVVARVTADGDGFTLAEVEFADHPPKPTTEQPTTNLTLPFFAVIDVITPALMNMLYRQGVREQWGAHMAPVDPRTKIWAGVVVAAAVAGWLLGRRR
jgi:hypothetical protein